MSRETNGKLEKMKATAHLMIDVQTRYFAPVDLGMAFAMAAFDDSILDEQAECQRLEQHNNYIEGMAARIDEFASVCRNIGVKNIYIQHANKFAAPNELADESLDPNNIAQMNQLYKQSPAEGDEIMYKSDKSAFVNTDLLKILKEEGIERIVISGGMLSDCVSKTALDAVMEDFEVIFARDLIAMAYHEFNGSTLDAKFGRWQRVMGIDNKSNDELAEALGFDKAALTPISADDKTQLYTAPVNETKAQNPTLPPQRNTGKLSK